jgi:hypothetical protein
LGIHQHDGIAIKGLIWWFQGTKKARVWVIAHGRQFRE